MAQQQQLTKCSAWSTAPNLNLPRQNTQRFAFPNARRQNPNQKTKSLNWWMRGFGNHARALVAKASNGGAGTEVAENTVVDRPKLQPFQVSQGHPSALGATARDGGVNFAVYSGNAVSVTLCLITLSDLEGDKVTELIPLDPLTNKTGNVWHVLLKGDFKDILYGYKFDGKFSPEEGHYYDSSRIVLDPYAKVIDLNERQLFVEENSAS
nr:isoamylase 1, chloroplastic-like isoform X2 [Malus domestica]